MENQAQNFTSGSAMGGMNIDTGKIISRVKAVLFDPPNAWTSIKAEQATIKELYLNYFLVLAALPPLCGFLGNVIFGVTLPFIGTIHPPFFSALGGALFRYVLSLGGMYVLALILQFVAKNFSGNPDLSNTFKLAAFSYVPAYVFGVLGIMPGFVAMIGGLLSLYSIYVFWTGVTPMTDVPEGKKIPFTIVSAILAIIVFAVIGVISAAMVPSVMPTPDFSHTATPGSFDPQKFQQGINELQKIIPNGSK
jgi:hypothetical protein